MTTVLIALTAVLGGCRRELPHAPATAASAKYVPLQLTHQSHDRRLQAELALAESAGGLPAQLDAEAAPGQPALAAALTAALSPSQLRFARERSDVLFARSADRWPPLALEQAIQFRAAYADAENAMRHAIQPQTRLVFLFAGNPAEATTCADTALVYVRLECIAAADAVSRGDGRAAVAALGRAWRMAEILAEPPHVATRLTAALARGDASGAMQYFAHSRIATADGLAQLERLVSQSLAAWPADERCWIGDRAAGLLTYEMIRDGQLLSVLTADELAVIRDEAGISAFAAAAVRHVDSDEAYYLQAMRQTIDACAQPYFERRAAIEAHEAERAVLANSPDHPLIADRLLLRGIVEGLRRQAADLALAQAWSIALAVACGASLPPPQINPVTGENFVVEITADRVAVSQIDPLRPQWQVAAPLAQSARISSRRVQAAPAQPR